MSGSKREIVRRNVSARGPEGLGNLRVSAPKDFAAGVPAIGKTLEHSFREMGLFRPFWALAKMNQQEGFDCPSCAWPDPDSPSKLGEFCENGAKALADEATLTQADAALFSRYSVEELSHLTDYEINKLGRLVEPMVLHSDSLHYEPISWEDALSLISDHLVALTNPNQAVFYTSGRSSNEAAFLYGTFARALGTNNLPDCSNMCHESSGVALSETLGIGKGSVTLDDLYGADLVIVAGQNPGTNHPRMLSALEKCKENGGKIISMNPLEEAGLIRFKNPQRPNGLIGGGTTLTDLHLPVKINQDIPLVKLLLKGLLEMERKGGTVFDREFIASKTQGFQELEADLDSYDSKDLLALTGIPAAQIEAAIQMLAASENIIICWAMGLTQHKNGVETIREYVNLLLAKGSIGKPNAGTCPVRGHSNVQGDRSVGIQHYVDPALNERIEKHLGFVPPDQKGWDVVESIEAMHSGKVKVFMALGGNFLKAASDTDFTAAALEACELTVQVSTKLNRSHLVTGKTALILPTLGRSEKEGKGEEHYLTTENSMGRVSRTRGVLKPAAGNLKSEPELIAELGARHFGAKHSVPWLQCAQDYGLIRKYIDLVAKGFSNTSERSKGKGYDLPNNARAGDFSKLPGGRAKFTVNSLPDHGLAADEFLLMTIRSHDQFNTTIYGLDDRYRGIYNERRVLLMNPEDMRELGIDEQQVVNLSSTYGDEIRRAPNFRVIGYAIPRGDVAAYFPETNPLIPIHQFADRSQTPISKSVRIRVETL